MEWRDQGILLGVRRHGETSVIAEIMTLAHGRHLGLVRGGRSRRMQPVLQPGNTLNVIWRARLDEHLGLYAVEPVTLRAARLMETATALHGIQAMAALLRLLPERDPHPGLYRTLDIILETTAEPHEAGELMVRFEMAVLNELGFGLDLSACAATGRNDELIYVSPKSGRAVSRSAGAPYADRLLPLPGFLAARETETASRDALVDAFRLTGYFFNRDIYEPRGLTMPEAREGFIQAVIKALSRRDDAAAQASDILS